jgi:hypothetical protein
MMRNKYIPIRLLTEHHDSLKIHSVVRDMSIQQLVNEAVQQWLDQQPVYEIITKGTV